MKTCTICKTNLPKKSFYKRTSATDGLFSCCKKCSNKATEKSIRTKKGLVLRIYTSQKHSSLVRSHNPPTYTKEQLYNWVMKQPNFNYLYNNWVESGYEKNCKPSVDRLEDDKGYSLSNIQLVTWKENRSSFYEKVKKGKINHNSKGIISEDKNGVKRSYQSLKDAERTTGIPNSNISAVCNGKRKSAGGFKWKFLN